MTSGSLDDLVRKWLLWDNDQTTAAEIRSLSQRKAQAGPSSIDAKDELEKRLQNRIQFGTAGLRGRMQAGFAFMNCLTVVQTSQGIAQYLVSSSPAAKPPSVLIGHDTRHNSARFARLAANAFRTKCIKVHMFEDYVPTPFVAFGVKTLNAGVGIMITASHNPAQDNGYKVYQSNGAQINTPVDEHIAQSILGNLQPWPGAWDESENVQDPPNLLATVRERYVRQILSLHHHTESNDTATHPKIGGVYTPMHGVGWAIVADVVLRVNHCTLIPVPEQIHPNPDFPTVKFPNPEEDGALLLAFETADRAGEKVVLANDPDGDRFAVAQKVDSSWCRFTGDQVGVLLADYLLEIELQRDAPRNGVMLCSAVSSRMLKKMVKAAGPRFHFEETLTGFKWIGNRAKQLQNDGYTALFGYEEAMGYMFPEVSWDKDGVAAMSTFLCALSHWKRQRLDPWTKLQELYQTFGYHESINTYFTSPNPSYTNQLFEKIRASEAMSRMILNSYRIAKRRDVTNGTEFGPWENKLPLDRTSEMLQFHLVEADTATTMNSAAEEMVDARQTDVYFTIRASGTEPKVKLYLECSSSTEDKAVHHATNVFSAIIKEWISRFGPELSHADTAISSSGRRISVAIG